MEEKEIVFAQNTPFEFERTADGKLVVAGWSIHTGIYQENTVEIPAGELKNIAESLVGKQLRKDHSHSVDSVIGQITETKISLDKGLRKKGVRYKGVIRDSELEQKINDGFIDNTSIGFKLTPECSKCGEDFRNCNHWFDEAHVIARDCQCYEQSFVSIGADNHTTVEPGASFSSQSDFVLQFDYKNKTNMEDEFVVKDEEVLTDDKELKMTIPPINVNINIENEKDSEEFSQKEDDGENMVETQELQDRIAALEQELSDVSETKDTLETELGEVKEQLEQKDSEIETLTQEKDSVQEELDGYKTREAEAAQLAKESLCEEIVKLQVDKGLLEEDKAETKAKDLFDLDESALEEMRRMAKAFKKEVVRDKPPVGEFEQQDEEPGLPEQTEEIDFSDVDLRDKMYAAMLGIRR